MSTNNVLVAFDESEGAQRALEIAADLVRVNPEAHLDIVYVAPVPLLDEEQIKSFKDIVDMMISDGENLLSSAAAKLDDSLAGRIDSLLLTGANPATEILKLVEQRHYDLLVIGNRGLSGIKEYLGSVSHKVLNGSHTSVLIAK